MGAAQNLRKGAFAFLDGSAPQVIAIKPDQIEGAKQGGVVVVPVAQEVEHREAALVDHDDLSVDEARPHRQVRNRFDDLRKAVGEVVAVPREQPDAAAVPPSQDAEPVVLDLVQPARACRRFDDGAG